MTVFLLDADIEARVTHVPNLYLAAQLNVSRAHSLRQPLELKRALKAAALEHLFLDPEVPDGDLP